MMKIVQPIQSAANGARHVCEVFAKLFVSLIDAVNKS